jgi:hypothetical protein
LHRIYGTRPPSNSQIVSSNSVVLGPNPARPFKVRKGDRWSIDAWRSRTACCAPASRASDPGAVKSKLRLLIPNPPTSMYSLKNLYSHGLVPSESTITYPDNSGSAAAMTCLYHSATGLLSSLRSSIEWPLAPARNICQSVEFFLQERMRGEGSISVLPALLIVKAYLRISPGDWNREILWIDDMVGKIQGKCNAIAGYV